MSFRGRVVLLGSLCGALLATWILGLVFSPDRRTGDGVRVFRDLKVESVAGIALQAGDVKISLSKRRDWVLEDAGRDLPASKAKVEGLLKEVAALTRGSAVTSREDAASGLGLTGSAAKVLTLLGGKGEKLAELTIGKAGTGGGGSYMRAGGEKQVYLTGATLSAYLDTERRYWSDLRLLPADLKAQNVTRISFRGRMELEEGKKVRNLDYALVRSADSRGKLLWIVEGRKDAVLDDQKVEQVVSNLLGCEGNDFTDSTEASRKALSRTMAEVTLSMGDNRDFTLFVASKAEGSQYYAGLKGAERGYLVPEWRLERIFMEKESLNPPAR